jgi:polysaccharide export outer membrane protein
MSVPGNLPILTRSSLRISRPGVALTTAWLLCIAAGCADYVPPAELGFPAPAPPRPYSFGEALRAFEDTAPEAYRLGQGDQVSVQVWERLDLSGSQIIGPDGALTIHVLGSVRVAGLTREEAAKAIQDGLSRLYTGILVTLRVEQYQANRVTVVGRVKTPGVFKFENAPSLLELIARAGGLAEGPVNLTHCAVMRGRDRVAWINLNALMDGRDLSLNLRLKPDDLVLVPEDGDLPVYVLGQVTKPGPIRWTRGMSFLDALAQAGGPGRDALPSNIYLVRPSKDLRIALSQGDLLYPTPGTNVALEQGDIIYVPTNFLADLGYIFEKLNPWGWIYLAGVYRR